MIEYQNDIIVCPECNYAIRLRNGIISRHERGLSYLPYRLYQKILIITGTSIKEQAKNNLCKASGKRFIY